MATYKTWSYPNTTMVQQFNLVFDNIPGGPIVNRWYKTNSEDMFVYVNSKFYYHLAIVKRYKNTRAIDIEDYICNKKGELAFSTRHGSFSSEEQLQEYIAEKLRG